MRTLCLVALMFISGMLGAQERPAAPAHVMKVEGVPFFLYAVPAGGYEVVGKAATVGHFIRLAVDEGSTVKDKAATLVKMARERQRKGKVPAFDAIILDLDKDKALAVTLRQEDSLAAKVLRQEGVPLYFFSLPDADYEVVAEWPADYSLRAARGLLYDKVRSMVRRALEKEKKGEVKPFDAIIIDPETLSETLIRFKK